MTMTQAAHSGTQTPVETSTSTGRAICSSEAIRPETAVVARASDRTQVAVVRTITGELFAVGHFDPYSQAHVIARGIVGTSSAGGQTVDVIQSPMYKQAFDLRTGRCLADDAVCLGVWQVSEVDGIVRLGENLTPATPALPG